jgi:hypothetical protein
MVAKQPNRQASMQTDKLLLLWVRCFVLGKQIFRQTDGQTDKQADKQWKGQSDRWIHRQTDKQALCAFII